MLSLNIPDSVIPTLDLFLAYKVKQITREERLLMLRQTDLQLTFFKDTPSIWHV